MTDLIPDPIREALDLLLELTKDEQPYYFGATATRAQAALDAERARNRDLDQRIHRQRIELAAANNENRRGNEFARRAAEARCANLEAVAEAARAWDKARARAEKSEDQSFKTQDWARLAAGREREEDAAEALRAALAVLEKPQ